DRERRRAPPVDPLDRGGKRLRRQRRLGHHLDRAARRQTRRADRLLGLARGGERHHHRGYPRRDQVQRGVVAELAYRYATLPQQLREVAAKALDRDALGRGRGERGELGLGQIGAGEQAPRRRRQTALP